MNAQNSNKRWIDNMLGALAKDPEITMTIFAAYLDEGLCYELFANEIPNKVYEFFCEVIKTDVDFRQAVKKSGIIKRGVKRYVRKAFDDYDMWLHFLDGIDTILANQELSAMLSDNDLYVARGLFELWNAEKLNSETWDMYLSQLCAQN